MYYMIFVDCYYTLPAVFCQALLYTKSSIKSDMEAGRGRTIAPLHLVTVLLHTEVLSGGRRQAFCLLSPFIEKGRNGDLSQGTPFHVIHPGR